MSFTIDKFSVDVKTKICLELDEKSLCSLAATCKPFHELIFSYPNPRITTNDTKSQALKKTNKWKARNKSAEKIWNCCFQKAYEKTIDELKIVLETNFYDRQNTLKLLQKVKNTPTKMQTKLNIEIILEPVSVYEKLKSSFFVLKLDKVSAEIEKKFEYLNNKDEIFKRLKFSIPPIKILDKVSIILFEKDYEKFEKTNDSKPLNRWILAHRKPSGNSIPIQAPWNNKFHN